MVLKGGTLAAIVMLGSVLHRSRQVTLNVPLVHFRLTSEPPPSVVVSKAPLEARVTPAVPISSRFIWFSETRCEDANGDGRITVSGWRVRGNGRIQPDGQTVCAHFIWHAIAGWLGHPIAAITYDSAGP
jgi:hypothetical protein